MYLLGHRSLRGVVLGLMFLLAGTTCCWSDSYDPDPYDDTPPVVTVEFNYVIPSRVSVRIPNTQAKNQQRIASRVTVWRDSAAKLVLFDNHVAPAFSQSPSHMVIPLRR
jgi:hypothetical protein